MNGIKNKKITYWFALTIFFQNSFIFSGEPKNGHNNVWSHNPYLQQMPLEPDYNPAGPPMFASFNPEDAQLYHDPNTNIYYQYDGYGNYIPVLPPIFPPSQTQGPLYEESIRPSYSALPAPTTDTEQNLINEEQKIINELIAQLDTLIDTIYGPPDHRSFKKVLRATHDDIKNLLRDIKRYDSNFQSLTTINPATGQAWIHKLIPLHWDLRLIKFFYQTGVNLSIPTAYPDPFPGSTLAHSAIGTRKNIETSTTIADDKKRTDFLIWFFNKYPNTLHQKSYVYGRLHSLENLCRKKFPQFLPQLNELQRQYRQRNI